MQSKVSSRAIFRDMSAEELQHHADELFNSCACNVLLLSKEDHDDLNHCGDAYFKLTGERLRPSANVPSHANF